MHTLTREHFSQVDMRVGTIVQVDDFPEAMKPAYKVHVDLGELWIKRTSAQITDLYTTDTLLGKQVICVVNFPPKQIGKFMSEILILWLVGGGDWVVLLSSDKAVNNWLKVG
jgi:tRNA-binding protein